MNALRRIRRLIMLSLVWPTVVLCDYRDVLQAQNADMIIIKIAPLAPETRGPLCRGSAKPHLWEEQKKVLTNLGVGTKEFNDFLNNLISSYLEFKKEIIRYQKCNSVAKFWDHFIINLNNKDKMQNIEIIPILFNKILRLHIVNRQAVITLTLGSQEKYKTVVQWMSQIN